MPIICEINPITQEPIYNIFQSMRTMWEWEDIIGDNNEMNFYLTDRIYISCRDFERCRINPYSSSTSAKIVLVCNEYEITLYSCGAPQFKPTSRAYHTRGSILQLGNGTYDADKDVLENSQTCLAFAVVHAVNAITQESSFGVYLPKTHGSISRTTESGHYVYKDVDFDPTPQYWVTKEMTRMVPNTGLAFVTGQTINMTGTITAKSSISDGGYVDITISNDIPGASLDGLQFSTIDSGGHIVSANIVLYDHTAHTITIQIAGESYDYIEIGATYTIANVEYPVKSAWIPIFGLGSECISSGASVRMKGTGKASSGLGGLWI